MNAKQQYLSKVLTWLGVSHNPGNGGMELVWLIGEYGKKGRKARILVNAFTETMHGSWKFRNQMRIGEAIDIQCVVNKIINVVVYRCWHKPKLRLYLSSLMMF